MRLFRVLVPFLLLVSSTCAVQALSYRVATLESDRCAPKGDCPVVFVATGEIERDELQNFRNFVGGLDQRAAGPRAFVISSEGGNLAGAFALGHVLRRIDVPVIVATVEDGVLRPGFCGSACVFALMGGRSRQVPAGSVVAVHAPRRVPERGQLGGRELSAATARGRRQITRILSDYARAMGVDPAVIALMMRVEPDARRVLTPAEVRRFRLARIAK
ncbi:MAG TPA: hypothetical protein VHG30_04110 [Microvirga sp.]|nr:hypothetical protein [Microvirga sp.]